jgi:hypothetical protein
MHLPSWSGFICPENQAIILKLKKWRYHQLARLYVMKMRKRRPAPLVAL